MGIKLRKVIFIILLFGLLGNIAFFIYTVVLMVIHINEWKDFMWYPLAGFFGFWLIVFLYLLRKRYLPVPGIDYK